MVESIKAIGVMTPIIVRPLKGQKNKFEILAGHNRVKASKEVGYLSIPAIIYSNLTDEQAMLIVTETNLIQRSFSDMSHSERAVALSAHYEAMKKKSGYRSDLIEEIEAITCSPLANRSRTMNKLGEQEGLSKDTIARYLRINQLTNDLKEKLDHNRIAVRTAVSLSYLRVEEQKAVDQYLQSDTKISMKQAKALKDKSSEGELSREAIEQILAQAPTKAKPIKELNWKLFLKYFNKKQSAVEIEGIITEALELYFSKNK
jgi:ParB family chromosome partitioning protein